MSERPLGYKFTRQKSIWPYIADFYCSKLLLVIEIDGDSHNAEYDLYRDNYLEDLQIKTIRYTNDEVMSNSNKVAEDIKQEMRVREEELGYASRHKPPPSPPWQEGWLDSDQT